MSDVFAMLEAASLARGKVEYISEGRTVIKVSSVRLRDAGVNAETKAPVKAAFIVDGVVESTTDPNLSVGQSVRAHQPLMYPRHHELANRAIFLLVVSKKIIDGKMQGISVEEAANPEKALINLVQTVRSNGKMLEMLRSLCSQEQPLEGSHMVVKGVKELRKSAKALQERVAGYVPDPKTDFFTKYEFEFLTPADIKEVVKG